jgi:hypothetical protein
VSAAAKLFEKTWVHVFEEDGTEGAVYRPDEGILPLSRRPRQRFSLSPDGSARLVVSGPDDRLYDVPARWTEEKGEIAVTPDSGTEASVKALHVRVLANDRLLVRR